MGIRFTVTTLTWLAVTNICVTDHGYVPFVVITIWCLVIRDLSPGL